MKKLIFPFLASFFISTTMQAKIWRVNNNAGIVADATTISILFDGTNNGTNPEAAIGDIIHVEPSLTTYAFPTINKQVTIIGNGFFLAGAGSNPGLQENTLPSKIGGVRFANGCQGTKIIGIEFTQGSDFVSGFTGNIDVVFEKSFFP